MKGYLISKFNEFERVETKKRTIQKELFFF